MKYLEEPQIFMEMEETKGCEECPLRKKLIDLRAQMVERNLAWQKAKQQRRRASSREVEGKRKVKLCYKICELIKEKYGHDEFFNLLEEAGMRNTKELLSEMKPK